MNKIIPIFLSLMISACAPWSEIKAPCTYEDRGGCGTLIYTHESLQ